MDLAERREKGANRQEGDKGQEMLREKTSIKNGGGKWDGVGRERGKEV